MGPSPAQIGPNQIPDSVQFLSWISEDLVSALFDFGAITSVIHQGPGRSPSLTHTLGEGIQISVPTVGSKVSLFFKSINK